MTQIRKQTRKATTPEKALAKFKGLKLSEITPTRYDSDILEADGEEYMVLTDSEADDKAAEYITESLWAFNADFIIDNTDLPYEAKEMIQAFQEAKCEGANETIKAMIKDLPGFIEAAISADGRGHFLNAYDGEENEQDGYYIYRTN